MDISQAGDALQAAGAIVGGASVIAALFPKSSKLGATLGLVSKLINIIAFNFGNAKNKDQ
jgi:hypothetical protein